MNKENERTLMADQNKLNSLRLEVDSVELDIQRSDKQIEIQRRDNESLRVQITQQQERATLLKEELTAVERHARVLEEQNRALVIELDKFSQADEAIKTTLDRKSRVLLLKENLSNQLQKSSYKVARVTSPERK